MGEAIQGRAIFISYRRDDSEGEAGRLYDDLARAYGDDSVFMDVAGIEPGLDFRKAIDANVASCGVLLAMIGPSWASVTDSSGTRRLENSNDFVRLEIASALARNVAVIPVLVHGAKMPPLDQLPDDLKDLRYRNSVELTHARWNSDVALLVTALKGYVTVNKKHETETIHATVPVQLPAPVDSGKEDRGKKSRTPLFLGLAVALVLVAVAGFFFKNRDDGPSPQITTQTVSSMEPDVAKPAHPANQAPGQVTGQVANPTVPAVPADAKPQPVVTADVPKSPTVVQNSPLLGKWKNSADLDEAGQVSQVAVSKFGDQLMVQIWDKCVEGVCDWGTKPATMQGSLAVTDWEPRNNIRDIRTQRDATVSLVLAGDVLQVQVKNLYHLIDPKTKKFSGETKQAFNVWKFVRAD